MTATLIQQLLASLPADASHHPTFIIPNPNSNRSCTTQIQSDSLSSDTKNNRRPTFNFTSFSANNPARKQAKIKVLQNHVERTQELIQGEITASANQRAARQGRKLAKMLTETQRQVDSVESEIDKLVLGSPEKSVRRDLIRLIHKKNPDPAEEMRVMQIIARKGDNVIDEVEKLQHYLEGVRNGMDENFVVPGKPRFLDPESEPQGENLKKGNGGANSVSGASGGFAGMKLGGNAHSSGLDPTSMLNEAEEKADAEAALQNLNSNNNSSSSDSPSLTPLMKTSSGCLCVQSGPGSCGYRSGSSFSWCKVMENPPVKVMPVKKVVEKEVGVMINGDESQEETEGKIEQAARADLGSEPAMVGEAIRQNYRCKVLGATGSKNDPDGYDHTLYSFGKQNPGRMMVGTENWEAGRGRWDYCSAGDLNAKAVRNPVKVAMSGCGSGEGGEEGGGDSGENGEGGGDGGGKGSKEKGAGGSEEGGKEGEEKKEDNDDDGGGDEEADDSKKKGAGADSKPGAASKSQDSNHKHYVGTSHPGCACAPNHEVLDMYNPKKNPRYAHPSKIGKINLDLVPFKDRFAVEIMETVKAKSAPVTDRSSLCRPVTFNNQRSFHACPVSSECMVSPDVSDWYLLENKSWDFCSPPLNAKSEQATELLAAGEGKFEQQLQSADQMENVQNAVNGGKNTNSTLNPSTQLVEKEAPEGYVLPATIEPMPLSKKQREQAYKIKVMELKKAEAAEAAEADSGNAGAEPNGAETQIEEVKEVKVE